jgi:hypothetical protein
MSVKLKLPSTEELIKDTLVVNVVFCSAQDARLKKLGNFRSFRNISILYIGF